MTVKTQSMYAQ